MRVAKDELREQIHRAFDDVAVPTRVEEMLLDGYRSSEDAYEMAAAFAGRAWASIPIEELFHHREMLGALSPEAYRAYLPAYLAACLVAEDPFDKFGADLRSYLLMTLEVWPHHNDYRQRTTPERLSLLDAGQRAAVAALVAYLVERWESDEAREVLAEW